MLTMIHHQITHITDFTEKCKTTFLQCSLYKNLKHITEINAINFTAQRIKLHD